MEIAWSRSSGPLRPEPMKREIGRTGTKVNAIGLGAWQLSNVARPPRDQAIALIHCALEAGVGLIDTADAYCRDENDFGHNECLIREALDNWSGTGEVTVMTKVGRTRPGGRWVTDARPEYIKTACDASLRRLGLEAIFLYQLHQVDSEVPFEDTLGALTDLREAGKIRHIGLSNVSLVQLEQAQALIRIESVQNRCNPWAREDVDNGLITHCSETGVTYFPWHPVGGAEGHQAAASNLILRELACKYETTPYQLLIAWLLGLGSHVIPIPGATRTASILDNLKAAKLDVAREDLARIGAIGRRSDTPRI